MPVQTQVSNLAAILGGRISAANELHKDKPVDKGFQDLPPGIKNGIAKLAVMIAEPYKDDKMGVGTKGKHGFRASAVVVYSGHLDTPNYHDGIKVVNMQTTMFASLCDIPANGNFKAVPFEDNWQTFINIFKMFGVVCQETKASDPTGQKTWGFYAAAMQALTDPKKPRYVSFSTSYYKRPKQAGESQEAFDKRQGKTYQNWHGEVEWKGITDPAQTVNVITNGQATNTEPHPTDVPPTVGADGLPLTPDYSTQSQIHSMEPQQEVSDVDQVAALLGLAVGDNEEAQTQLMQMAMARGWTQDEVEGGSWADVGVMALNDPVEDSSEPTVGSKWKYVKRDSKGNKLKDDKGNDLLPVEVEVVSVDSASQSVTLKAVKGGKDITDLRTRKPAQVKWEWLES